MKIKHVYGNVLKLDIPLTIKIRTMESDVPTEREEPFYPDVSKGCTVILGNSYNRKIQYDATVSGNVAHIEDDGVIGIGTYKVTVKCYDEEGNPYRYMVRDIIEICDATIDAGIEAGVEFNVETYTLEGAVFVSYGGEQVQSDWAETDPEEKSFIKNKPDLTQYATKNELREVESEIPTLPDHIVTDEHYVHTDNNYTTEEKQKLANAITEEQDPTVPSWAKQPTKPSYTAQEVGALPANTPLFDGDYNSLTNKPDLSGFITISVNNLVNYYLKSETYTKQEVQALINAVKQFTYEVVQTLPTASAETMHKIYLVPSVDPQTQNVKDEYITIDNGTEAQTRYTWEQIGSTAIDLSGYVTTSALNTALADYTTTANLTTLLAGKQDTISDLSTIRSGAQAGATAYQKPAGGIPKTDLAQDVKDSLDKADSALQEDTLYVKVNNNGHEYVDLGLPSGTLWAKCNVGADAETGYGNYYMYGKGARQYNSSDSPYTGNEDPLDLSADTARQVLGGSWKMPTQVQMQELIDNTTYEFTTINGVDGAKFTAQNGNFVFFPAAGDWDNGSLFDVGDYGYYWGSSPVGSDSAFCLYFNNGNKGMGDYYREYGYSVRGVILPEKTQLKKDLDSKANTEDLADVAFSGSYNDLDDKPTIPTVPTNVSAFNNDAGYLTQHQSLNNYYTKTEVNGLVDTPHQEYVTVDAYASLPATGSEDTIYRVSNYNGSTSQVDESVYSEYAWNGSQYIFLCVKSQIGEVFDISVYNNNAKYADLAAALNGGANIPQSLQKGGMSVKFVRTSDNKYVEYFLTKNEWSANEEDWQESTPLIVNYAAAESDLDISDESGNVLARFAGGHIRTKNFDSSIEPKPLEGRTFSILGDSISTFQGYLRSDEQGYDGATYAYFYPKTFLDSVNQTWWKKLESLTGMTLLQNCAWSGSQVCGNSQSTTSAQAGCSTRRISDLSKNGVAPDIILILIGVNDLRNSDSRALGDWDGNDEIVAESTNVNTFSSAYSLMVSKIMTTYPNSEVFCCTILDTGHSGWDTHDNAKYPCMNDRGNTTKEWNDTIRMVCESLGANVLDMHSCGIDFFNLDTYTGDRLHPNASGATLMAKKAARELISKSNLTIK